MELDRTRFCIQILENGPYVVLGGVPLIRRYPVMSIHGEPLEWDPVGAQEETFPISERYELCRCGKSNNKPFCDQTHERTGFQGTLTADRRPTSERRTTDRGSDVVMTDDLSLCSNAGFCGTRLTNVWEMITRADDPEVKTRLLRMVANCPSGRLVAWLEGGQPLEPEYEPSIAVVTNGPYWVRGGITIQAPDGFIYEVRNRVTLCRCGRSKNMPFCDGTHDQIKFQAP